MSPLVVLILVAAIILSPHTLIGAGIAWAAGLLLAFLQGAGVGLTFPDRPLPDQFPQPPAK